MRLCAVFCAPNRTFQLVILQNISQIQNCPLMPPVAEGPAQGGPHPARCHWGVTGVSLGCHWGVTAVARTLTVDHCTPCVEYQPSHSPPYSSCALLDYYLSNGVADFI